MTATTLRAVRFGIFNRGVFHLAPPVAPRPGERFPRAADLETLCGREAEGASECWADRDTAESIGRICKRCLNAEEGSTR